MTIPPITPPKRPPVPPASPGRVPFTPGGSFGASSMGFLFHGHPSGIGQSTPAMRLLHAKASGARGGRRSARKRRLTAKKRRSIPQLGKGKYRRRKIRVKRVSKRTNRVLGSGFKLRKGSPEAKRHMAKLRRMRKK